MHSDNKFLSTSRSLNLTIGFQEPTRGVQQMPIYQLLDQLQIPYQRFDHEAVFTCEEARQIEIKIPGMALKNIFVRNRKGDRHYLIAVPEEKAIDLKKLGQTLGSGTLSLASADRLNNILSIAPGSVSLLALINDNDQKVHVVIDKTVWSAGHIQCHPLINTSTLVLAQTDLQRFLNHTGHTVSVMEVPARCPKQIQVH